jgi:hypothetical protein
VRPDGTGARVTVTVALRPVTMWRKHLLVYLRRPSLQREMKDSLLALSTTLVA